MKKRYLFYTVQYGSIGKKWAFRWPGNNTLIVECKGREMADKVARVIAGSLKRNDNKLDNLARANITQILRGPALED